MQPNFIPNIQTTYICLRRSVNGNLKFTPHEHLLVEYLLEDITKVKRCEILKCRTYEEFKYLDNIVCNYYYRISHPL